jgi:broad specificity phosphatase PhoE
MTPPPVAYFVRHGQTDWNAERRFQGQADTAINALGREQAACNGRRLAELEREPGTLDFVASPLLRTRQTMQLLRAALGLEPDGFRTEPRLMELHFGDWQGRTLDELEREQPGIGALRERDKWHFLPPGEGAESYEMLSLRVRDWLGEQMRPLVCVTHGGVMRAVLRMVGGATPEEAAQISIPHDRMLVMRHGQLAWH